MNEIKINKAVHTDEYPLRGRSRTQTLSTIETENLVKVYKVFEEYQKKGIKCSEIKSLKSFAQFIIEMGGPMMTGEEKLLDGYFARISAESIIDKIEGYTGKSWKSQTSNDAWRVQIATFLKMNRRDLLLGEAGLYVRDGERNRDGLELCSFQLQYNIDEWAKNAVKDVAELFKRKGNVCDNEDFMERLERMILLYYTDELIEKIHDKYKNS